ncbi:MAG TPA: SDR family oxidoreductase [Bacteroidia bacterium]
MQVKNKTIIVTGAGNGIGREVALQLLSKGAKVAAVDVKEEFLKETLSLAGSNAASMSIHALDITNMDALNALPEKVIAIHGHIDGLMNIAGIIQPFVRFNDLDEKIVERVMNVNFFGPLHLTKIVLPYLLKRPEGHILNVSSMGGFLPVPGQTIYGASKAALKLFTEGLNAELSTSKVGVSIVFPGGVGTNITKNSNVEIKGMSDAQISQVKMVTAQKAASIMIEGIEKNKFRILIGQDAKFMDFLCRLAPTYAKDFIRKKMAFLLD